MNGQAIKHIVITGNTISAWQFALGLRATMPFVEFDITLVSSRDQGPENSIINASPTLEYFHRILGLDEKTFMRRCDARFSLADYYQLGLQKTFFLSFAEGMHSFSGLGLQHLVRRLQVDECENMPSYDHRSSFSLGAAAAAAAKFSHPNTKQAQIDQELLYGYCFLAEPYLALMQELAVKKSIQHKEVESFEWAYKDNSHAELLCFDGQNQMSLDADFFVDCSSLAENQPGFKKTISVYETRDTLQALPDRTVDPILYNDCAVQYISTDGGVQQVLRSRSAFIQRSLSNRALAFDNSDHKLGSNCELQTLGYLPQAWQGNRLFVGKAVANLGELSVNTLQLAQSALLRFVDLFPVNKTYDLCSKEFNYLASIEYERVMEFHIAQLFASKLSAFSELSEKNLLPSALLNKLKVFKQRGEFPQYESESMGEQIWQSLFLKCGVIPDAYSVLLDDFKTEEIKSFLSARQRSLAATVGSMYDQKQYLSRYLGV